MSDEQSYPTLPSEWSKLWALGVGFGVLSSAGLGYVTMIAAFRAPEWLFIFGMVPIMAATYCASASITLRQRIVDETEFDHEAGEKSTETTN